MEENKIAIGKRTLLDRVHEITAYTAAKNIEQDKDSFKRIDTNEIDEQFLEDSINESFADLGSTLKQYKPSISFNGIYVEISLEMPSNFCDLLNECIMQNIEGFFVYYTIYKWYSIVNKQDAEMQLQAAMKYLATIKNICSERITPTRGTINKSEYGKFFYE